jgi:hypothetical protein
VLKDSATRRNYLEACLVLTVDIYDVTVKSLVQHKVSTKDVFKIYVGLRLTFYRCPAQVCGEIKKKKKEGSKAYPRNIVSKKLSHHKLRRNPLKWRRSGKNR